MAELAVHGCVSGSAGLASLLGVEGLVECTVSGEAPSSLEEASRLLSLVVSEASRVLGEARPAGRPRWEGIGVGRYRVYSMLFKTERGGVEARLVTAEWLGKPLLALVAAPWRLPRDEWGSPLRGPRRPSWSPGAEGGDAPRGQKPIPRFIPYMAEEAPGSHPGYIEARGPGGEAKIGYEEIAAHAEPRRLDFHCVTGWSVEGREWLAAPFSLVLEEIGAPRSGCWVAAVSVMGYAAVMPCSEAWGSYLAIGLDGEALPLERGGPVRLLAPSLYGWKSVKWLSRVEVLEGYVDGFWEALGYHERGRWDAEERFKIRNPELDGGPI